MGWPHESQINEPNSQLKIKVEKYESQKQKTKKRFSHNDTREPTN